MRPQEIIGLAAERAQVDTAVVAEAEWPKSIVMRLVDAIDELAYGVAMPSTWLPKPSRKELRGLIRETVLMVAERGRAVIVAHAASIALGPRPGILRVLVTAPRDVRVDRLRASGLVGVEDAAATVDESDRNRLQYLDLFYGVREETPLHYDVVLNTERLDADRAAAMIVAAARA